MLADSQCLFGEDARRWLRPGHRMIGGRAVYLGASNGNDPAAFEIFDQAMAAAGFTERLAIDSASDQGARLDGADVILLAGGDPLVGWQAFEESGLVEPIRRCWQRGVLLIGVSAGAVQLGLGIRTVNDETAPMFALVPYWVGAHEEDRRWSGLEHTVRGDEQRRPALAIPFGAAARVGSKGSVGALRKPVGRMDWSDDQLSFEWQGPNENERETLDDSEK